jgi:hypothetical protein
MFNGTCMQVFMHFLIVANFAMLVSLPFSHILFVQSYYCSIQLIFVITCSSFFCNKGFLFIKVQDIKVI